MTPVSGFCSSPTFKIDRHEKAGRLGRKTAQAGGTNMTPAVRFPPKPNHALIQKTGPENQTDKFFVLFVSVSGRPLHTRTAPV